MTELYPIPHLGAIASRPIRYDIYLSQYAAR